MVVKVIRVLCDRDRKLNSGYKGSSGYEGILDRDLELKKKV